MSATKTPTDTSVGFEGGLGMPASIAIAKAADSKTAKKVSRARKRLGCINVCKCMGERKATTGPDYFQTVHRVKTTFSGHTSMASRAGYWLPALAWFDPSFGSSMRTSNQVCVCSKPKCIRHSV